MCMFSASWHDSDDFQLVARFQRLLAQSAPVNEGAVFGDGHRTHVDLTLLEEAEDGGGAVDLERRAVHADVHFHRLLSPAATGPADEPVRGLPHAKGSCAAALSNARRRPATAAHGSGASMTAEMTATPEAPARSAAGAVSAVTPPTARTGTGDIRAVSVRRRRPRGGWPGLERLGKTWPKVM